MKTTTASSIAPQSVLRSVSGPAASDRNSIVTFQTIHPSTCMNDHPSLLARCLPRLSRLSCLLLLAALALMSSPHRVAAQTISLANPHWNITLSDFGYSDFLLDNTPGFEGREYLSGEWGAAVGYQIADRPVTLPEWLEPQFLFPDWTTRSRFRVVTPLTQTGLNADGLPIAQSIIDNRDVEITLRYEMLDTVIGTPMGTKPASATGDATFLLSDRYVLKQTCSIKNISGAAMINVQFFQLLHGLQSQRGLYDNRPHAGPLSEFRYDVTQAGVDAAAVGAGSSSAGLEDFIGFHASATPSAYEVGYFGIEGNGVDDHALGKPSDGVHLSIEDNWQSPPYSARLGTDNFAPPQRWVAGAQRWNLGALAPNQSAALDVLLTLRTGTRVIAGTGSSGGCNGGASVPGGVDYKFEDVTSEGSCFAKYSKADENEIAVHVAAGEFTPFTFLTPGGPAQVWEMEFSGAFSGSAALTFGYDATVLPAGFDETALALYQFTGDTWLKLASAVDTVTHTIAVNTTNLSVFALGVDALNTFNVTASAAPANSGVITGAGTYAEGASVTLVATANAGYVFSNWTENAVVVSASPSHTFIVHAGRALVANFALVGTGRAITTSALPSNGGSTSGDGEYAIGSSATVVATPNAGYKFSKWLVNGVEVSTAPNYTFTVTGHRALVAKFKPVYSMIVSADPVEGGDVEADPVYEFGELARLKAKPNRGYSFVNWTQNGVSVSDDEIYQFNVTGNRTLVAHFALGHLIRVSAEPVNGGVASGGGVYAPGANVIVEASAYPGYVFLNWTENGDPVSASASYSFTSDASRTLIANFIAQSGLSAVRSAPGVLTLSWPAGATGWTLQESDDPSPGSWVDSTGPVTIQGNQKQVTVSPLSGRRYFRLTHP